MLHYFNPGHESAVLNGSPYYHAPANVIQMQRDLAFLPAWLAGENDFVLIEDALPDDFINFWKELPNFSVKGVVDTSPDVSALIGQEPALWGISLQSIHRLTLLSEKYALQLKIPRWNPLLGTFTARQQAAVFLSSLSRAFPFVSSKLIPRFLTSLKAVDDVLEQENESSFLAKAPYSSSGRGLLWLPKAELSRTERQILSGYLKKQGAVSIEYVLEKKVDFAMEFYCDGIGGCRFEGYSLFETNDKGNYGGNIIASQERIIETLSAKISIEQVSLVKERLLELFSTELATVYKGYMGVDMMIYFEDGQLKLHPCVEINLRSNMGILAFSIQKKYVHPQVVGHFFVEYYKSNKSLCEKHSKMQKLHPATFVSGKMYAGYFPLCPINDESRYLAYVFLE